MLFFGGIASAQNNPVDTNTYVILKNDSNEYIGKILSDDGREVLINTDKLGKRQFTDFNGLSAVSSYSFPIPMCSWFYKF